jgi:hypothetical protein
MRKRIAVLAASAVVASLAVAGPASADVLIIQGDLDDDFDAVNFAYVESDQSLQQVGGDQFATATGSGDGDVAAANNQEFEATQTQQSLAIAGEGNAAAQNAGDILIHFFD